MIQKSNFHTREAQQVFSNLKQLQELRDHAVLFIGSGNVVHNLRAMLGTLALAHEKDSLKFFNEEVVMDSIGMRSFILQ